MRSGSWKRKVRMSWGVDGSFSLKKEKKKYVWFHWFQGEGGRIRSSGSALAGNGTVPSGFMHGLRLVH